MALYTLSINSTAVGSTLSCATTRKQRVCVVWAGRRGSTCLHGLYAWFVDEAWLPLPEPAMDYGNDATSFSAVVGVYSVQGVYGV
jgi:hypothetical protein